ncbi:DUF2634 domain-containing protein [Paenibacillus sp. S-38]|uniref:DUF2634 domain-containing protein n=1 Tax=Paenibacillus sp. S-38 TaxID=3416710 RepID=UPI003CF3F472
MKSFKLSEDGDLVIKNGELQMVEGDEELLQCIRIELSTYKGEWFLDSNMGVDYYGKILVKNPNYAVIKAELTAAILREPRIRSVDLIEFVNFDRAKRVLSIKFKATAWNGRTLESNEVIPGAG